MFSNLWVHNFDQPSNLFLKNRVKIIVLQKLNYSFPLSELFKFQTSIIFIFAIIAISSSLLIEEQESETNSLKPRDKGNSRSEMNEKIVLALLKLERDWSQESNEAKTRKLHPCSFSFEKMNREDGICTHFGACRFQGTDYMYQGGCGEQSRLSLLNFTNPMVCSMMVTRSSVVKGNCTKSGHCWAGNHIKLLHTGCPHWSFVTPTGWSRLLAMK